MHLFDHIEREDMDLAGYSEPSFQYLNRSERPAFQFIRQTLEEWFSRYPFDDKAEFQARFRSRLNVHHTSAVFELFLHELLLCLDCAVKVHPNIDNTNRSPDFLVTSNNSESFYLEATICTFQSDEEVAAEARLNQVYDVLNRRVESTIFFISVEVNSSPNSQPPGRKIAQFINQRLKDLDPDEVAKLYESGEYNLVPRWIFEHDGWSISFSPIPKKPSKRGKPSVQPIGMFSSGGKFVDHRTPLRDSILDKASAYGELGKPYIVGVNVMENIDEIDVMEALFGKEQFNIIFSQSSPLEVVDTKMTRLPDGVWTSTTGPKNSRLSAALIVRNLRNWSFGEAHCCMYQNPWANYSSVSFLADLPQAVADGEKINMKEGKSIIEILGIDWAGMVS